MKMKEDKINLKDYCTKKIEKMYPGQSPLEITDSLDDILPKVESYFVTRKEVCDSRGVGAEYELCESLPHMIISYSLIHNESLWLANFRKCRATILRTMCSMPWQGFEKLCVDLLKISGVNPVKQTKTNQEGIDFIGLYNIDKEISLGIIPKKYQIKVIGQAKRYSKKVEPGLVRSFKTYYDETRNGQVDLPIWFTKNEGPILGIFYATSSFTRRAANFAQKEWIILKNGEQIIEDLTKLPIDKNWFSQDKKGELKFNKELFISRWTNRS
ncbi:MAG TPA: restriction endonuclease [bacterium]